VVEDEAAEREWEEPRPARRRKKARSGPQPVVVGGLLAIALAGLAVVVVRFGFRDREPAVQATAPPPAPQNLEVSLPHASVPGTAKWQSDPALDERLAPYQQVGGFRVRTPKDYLPIDAPNAGAIPPGSELFGWTGPRRPDGTSPSFTVVVMTLPPEVSNYTTEELLTEMLGGVARRRSSFKVSPVEAGEAGGLSLVRARWVGTDKESGVQMRGFMYVGKHAGQFVQVSSQDIEPGRDADLALAEAAALTLRTK
jgi:hypothetical protein